MAKENFMPKGLSKVAHRLDGTVERIIAVCESKKVVIMVKNGKPKRKATAEIPYFEIPEKKFHPFYRQIGGIISEGKKTAKRFKNVKKIDWAANLKKCNITIEPDGKVTTYRRHYNKKTGDKKLVPMPAKDIGAAIRMQKHIGDYYERFFPPTSLSRMLKKLAIIQPILELRTLQLICARDQMQATIDQAFAKLNQIGKMVTDLNRPSFKMLEEKIAQLLFLLKNHWACPYLPAIDQSVKHLKRAKRAAASGKLQTAIEHLVKAKFLLAEITREKLSAGKKLSEIDPIMTLGKIGWLDKTDEVLSIAKRRFPNRKFFHLEEMLDISRLVILLAEANRKNQAAPKLIIRQKKLAKPAENQAALDFGS